MRVFEMATFVTNFQKCLSRINGNSLEPFLRAESLFVNIERKNHMFRHLAAKKDHPEEYEYEVSKDPKEWEFVEKLMPLETVPEPSIKPNYPSGWRPQSEEALKHPYYVERTKNHMLPVYLNKYQLVARKTRVGRIHGDIWRLHNELKEEIEKQHKKPIASQVNEGSNWIQFRGDFVYHCEQFLLRKGF